METNNINQPVPSVQNAEQPQSAPQPNPSSSLRTFIIVLCVVLLTIIGAVGYKLGTRKNQTVVQNQQSTPSSTVSQPSPAATPDDTTNWKTYSNSKYKVSFDYPPNYSINTDNDLIVTLEDGDKLHDIEIEFVSPLDDEQKNEPFPDFAAAQGMENCKASGARTQSYCDKVIKETPLQNPHALTGHKFLFHWLRQQLASDSKSYETTQEGTAGPVLAYDVSKYANGAVRGLLLFIGPLDNQPGSIDPSLLDNIGNSLRFTRQ